MTYTILMTTTAQYFLLHGRRKYFLCSGSVKTVLCTKMFIVHFKCEL